MVEDDVIWKPVSLTFVEYPQGDLLGKLLAYLSLTPIFILVGFCAILLFRRELHTITFLAGLVLNEAVNWTAKHLIKEPRPVRGHEGFGEYGMPSSHSQFMFFFAVYIILFICIRLHQPTSSCFIDNIWRILIGFGVVILAIIVSYSRIYLLYHTTSQVLCGALLGIILAIPWFFLTHVVFTPFFPWVVSWGVSEYFMIRDSTLIPNILWFEYTTARTEARQRNRKLSSKSQ
ncbi:dolichyldiphosphatase 1-like [Anneissia japonica]|uniref:dolichyldiphosphatase 1-like n=1 Tax=Anneissia japonica TaxID=1529436 RepID=UPI00142565FA|nr:dolichyldiphosphatase 1-like [Anneissia japonica]